MSDFPYYYHQPSSSVALNSTGFEPVLGANMTNMGHFGTTTNSPTNNTQTTVRSPSSYQYQAPQYQYVLNTNRINNLHSTTTINCSGGGGGGGGGGACCDYTSNCIETNTIQSLSNHSEYETNSCGNEYIDNSEILAMERKLAEDAQWKKIQQNTFTRWANEHLKSAQKYITNLETDLSDGLQLISLIEVLTHERLIKYNKRPTFRSQKLENVSLALKLLQDKEGIKIINIDSSHIVDGKLKLILGLVWTLILHYSFSIPMWDGEEEPSNSDTGPTPKQRLTNWIQGKLPDLPVKNFTTDWNDGKAIGALVDSVAPGLCPDWQDWNPNAGLNNATEAMGLADDWLNIPQLITPEEIVDPNIDEQSVMTYLAQYPNAKLKDGAPLRPKTNPNKVRVYGPGVEASGPVVGAPINFTVETFAAGKGDVNVSVENPNGRSEPVTLTFNNDRSLTYTANYTPQMEGEHKITVEYGGRPVTKSPYTVQVNGYAGDPKKVTVSGPGLNSDTVCIDKSTYFNIFTKDAGNGVPEVIILDPSGNKDTTPVHIRHTDENVWCCEYVTPTLGLHSVNVFFAGQPIPHSPFGIRVGPVIDVRKIRTSGRGLKPNGIRERDIVQFLVHTERAGDGAVNVQIIGPDDGKLPHEIEKSDTTTYQVTYQPKIEGKHRISVTFADQEINKSPFEVNVGPYMETTLKTYGPGLHGGVTNYPAVFTVETNGETGGLGFSIQGPSQAQIECKDHGDCSADVKYYPTVSGEYAVHVLCNNEDIPGSPFIVQILPQTDYHPERVKVSGNGIKNAKINTKNTFTIDTSEAGTAPLDVQITDGNQHKLNIEINEQTSNGIYQVCYTPLTSDRHTIQINYGGVAVEESPYRVQVIKSVDPTPIVCYGPGIHTTIETNQSTYFTVDANDTDEAELEVHIINVDQQTEIPVKITPNGDRTYTIAYAAIHPGRHEVNLYYDHQPVPMLQPIQFFAEHKSDLSNIKIDGLKSMIPVNSLHQFRVILPKSRRCEDYRITIVNSNGVQVTPQYYIIPTHEGYLVNFTPSELDDFTMNLHCMNELLLSRRVTCYANGDPSKVTVTGDGLHFGIVNQLLQFLIDTRWAGQGSLGIAIEGPCEAVIQCHDNGNGTCSVTYIPTEAGDYNISVTFNQHHIRNSPFQVVIRPNHIDTNRIRVSGSGVELYGVFLDSPTGFAVDTRDICLDENLSINDDKVTCKIVNSCGNEIDSVVTSSSNGIYLVTYIPSEEGQHTIEIFYDKIPIPVSPFLVNVRRGSDAKKCVASGPGLEQGILNKSNVFTVETKGAGTGGLSLSIEGPSEAKMHCKDNRDGSCTVEYIPTRCGEYDVAIRFANQHINGSPFKVECIEGIDEKLVRAYGDGLDPLKCRAGVPVKFTIDSSGVAPAPVAFNITCMDPNVVLVKEPDVYDNGDGTIDIHYTPPLKADVNLCAEITYNGHDIPNSPYNLIVRPKCEPDQVHLIGECLNQTVKNDCLENGITNGISASIPATFIVDTTRAGIGDLDVEIITPDGSKNTTKILDNQNGTFDVTFLPHDCGRYKINVKYGGYNVTEEPIPVQVYAIGDAQNCCIANKVEKIQYIGESNSITVKTENAGNGKVTCRIRSVDSDRDLETHIVDNHDDTVNVLYTIQDSGEYTANIKYGGQTIPDGFYTFTVEEVVRSEHTSQTNHTESYAKKTTKVSTTNHLEQQTYRSIDLDKIPLPKTGGEVTAEIKMPSGNVDKPLIEDNHDGTVSVKYDPREEGVHELAVKFNGEHVQGSPYKIHVDSISSGYVTAYGTGLTHGVSGEPSNFMISTKGAGAGGLSMAVEGPSKAEITCHDNKDGTVSVSYLPTAPGEYKISVRFGDKHIKGSPFNAKITGEGRKRNQISVGSCSEVSLPGKISDRDIRSLNASIQAPSGLEEPCFLKRLPTGNIGISFTPREIGEHVVSVKKLGNHITNSPFKITVCEKEVGNAKKVKVSGKSLKDGKTHTQNAFNVDTRNAGFGGLSVSIEGPSKAEIQCNDNSDGTLNLSYKPTEPGYYIVNLKFADHHVEGSPFTVKVTGEGTNRQRERIQRQREAIPATEVGHECKLTFKMPGITSFELSANVTSPGNVTEDAITNEISDGLYAVHFTPKELGVHTVSVKYKEIHIPGSPFQFTVGPYRDHGAHLVKAGGSGLERGEQGEINEFNVWTREAGSGQLAISVEGPSKAEINFTDRKDGSCNVSYKVTEPGEYRIGLKFNDQHVPESPFKVYISPAVGDAHLLEVAQFPQGCIQADKPSQFIVRRNGAKGNLDARIISPSGHEDDCFVQMIDIEECSIRFMPHENGIHKIHAKFNGVHIPGSPFSVKVGKDTADPAAVHASGNGLGDVKTGAKTDFIIDTINAGAGTLAVNIDGPSKVSMDCTEVEEGYKVRYTPLAPGDYYISIKYNNNHIVGSPFRINSKGDRKMADVGGQESSSVVVETTAKVGKSLGAKGIVLPHFKSNAAKVVSKGMGLKKAYLGKQNQFTVNAQDAGTNILFIGIHGPKGPCEEVYIKHQGRNQYNINYIVKERGDFIIFVKWGDDHIPGSPFKVEV